jgi:hypothetical protein
MIVKLFDIQGKAVVPTEHCFTLKTLKGIMDKYPDNYLKIYQYLFYMTCPNPDLNVFFNVPAEDKEEIILKEVAADFTSESELVPEALAFCKKLYETPTSRAFEGIKTMMDNLARYMANTQPTHGRDGSIGGLLSAAEKYQKIRESFKGAYSDHMEEQGRLRGGSAQAYDQK